MPPKIDAAKLVLFRVSAQGGQDWNRLLTDLSAHPGITAVAATSDLPLVVARRSAFRVELDDSATHKQTSAIQMDVTPDFFGVLQLRFFKGAFRSTARCRLQSCPRHLHVRMAVM